ncbi:MULTISPECIES: dihydrofolate reductase family protein [unclassified Streptomyces]|uniref:dihydrofolate reductase family protein n=1 Tax=unclassified Streptomyces TaxID=2593676 RepID=UPI0022587B2C|nr:MULTISPECIES: dihydrofolate reductase family protein [unclassified Streptomyces]MCX5143775.1 dihydrofolate reductase family protein [Streptomyces sp. NBC_00338]WRZ68200.1 dihydrofolate reductase family protein [Streptomyces sp. NBC_01257]WSU62144.1 dihydrofolate reductase family protein [Streptomyces sp. NBC_01104]
MRKIIYSMSMSLDGFIEGPDRDISWHLVDEELHRYFNERIAAMGGFLDGRVVHELMADFWPTADQDPANAGPMADFAVIWRNMPKYVYSRTLERADWNTTVVHEVVREEVMALKEQPGGDLSVGGAGLAASFAELDLIDEYWVYVHPVLIGRGKPMFPSADTLTALRLTGTRTFGNGVVELRYERAGTPSRD